MTKRKILSFVFFFCVRADGLEAKLTSSRHLSMLVFGLPRALRRCLNLSRLSLNVVFEAFVLSTISSPISHVR